MASERESGTEAVANPGWAGGAEKQGGMERSASDVKITRAHPGVSEGGGAAERPPEAQVADDDRPSRTEEDVRGLPRSASDKCVTPPAFCVMVRRVWLQARAARALISRWRTRMLWRWASPSETCMSTFQTSSSGRRGPPGRDLNGETEVPSPRSWECRRALPSVDAHMHTGRRASPRPSCYANRRTSRGLRGPGQRMA